MTKEKIQLWEERLGMIISNPVEFFDGIRDCENGNNYKQGMGAEYLRGYCAQYIYDQNSSIEKAN